MKSISITLSGRVQGVGFRYFVLETARHFNIKGFVRNMPGGEVYIEAEGKDPDLQLFVHKCRQGPPRANVDQMCVNECPSSGYADFLIR